MTTTRLFAFATLMICCAGAHAGVIAVPGGYEVSYGIRLDPGSSNGSDIESVFVFEWDDANFSSRYHGTIAGYGDTYKTHVIDFLPTSALIMGFGAGKVGVGDEEDHLYTITSLPFSRTVGGLKWSEAFPGVPADPGASPPTPSIPRTGHRAMVELLREAAAEPWLQSKLEPLENWVQAEGYRAAFDPAGSFAVLEWTECDAGEEIVETSPGVFSCVPVGGSIPAPAPATLALLGLGLAGLGFSKRKHRA